MYAPKAGAYPSGAPEIVAPGLYPQTLDLARKARQGQILLLIINIDKLQL